MQVLVVKDIVDFILENRSNKAYCGWSKKDIVGTFCRGFGLKLASYSVDSATGKIDGVVNVELVDKDTVRVSNILCLNKKALKKLMLDFVNWWPGKRIVAKRRGKEIVYKDTSKLIKKILSFNE